MQGGIKLTSSKIPDGSMRLTAAVFNSNGDEITKNLRPDTIHWRAFDMNRRNKVGKFWSIGKFRNMRGPTIEFSGDDLDGANLVEIACFTALSPEGVSLEEARICDSISSQGMI